MITLVTHYTPSFDKIAEVTIPVMEEYCKIHGYRLNVYTTNYDKYNGIIKLQQIQENLIEDGSIVFSLDADCLLTNMSKSIEYFLNNEKSLYVCEGLNMGAFIIKKSEWSDKLLNTMTVLIMRGEYHCEQDAIEDLIKNEKINTSKVEIVKHPAFNSYLPQLYFHLTYNNKAEWHNGDFILHVPALSLEKRAHILNEYKQYIVYE